MQNLVPHFILEKHAAGQRQGQFSATSLFVDISGFSAVTNALLAHGSEAAEALADVMCRIFEPLVDAVYAQGGFIATFAGDAFTALFPVGSDQPSAVSYERALAAAVAVQQHMIAHPVQATPYGRFPFTVKLGLGDGEVDWGILQPDSSAQHRDQVAAYYFGGSAVEAAAEGAVPEAKPVVPETATPRTTAEEISLKPTTTAAAEQVAETIAAAAGAQGVAVIIYGDIHLHNSTGISIGKDPRERLKKKRKKSKRKS